MYKIIDGKAISEQIKTEIAAEVEAMIAAGKKRPHLAVIIVGHDGGSETYVAHKVKSCEQVGFTSTKIALEADVTEAELLAKIDQLNKNPELDGFIVFTEPSNDIHLVGRLKSMNGNDICKRIYEAGGVSPCLPTGFSGNTTPKVIIDE